MKDKMLLPNFYGIFEVKSLTKNRIRIEIDKLKNNREEINELTENLKKISVIKNFKIIQSLGSLTVEFDNSQIDSQFMLGIILKLKNSPEYAKLVKKYFPEHYDNFIANQKKK